MVFLIEDVASNEVDPDVVPGRFLVEKHDDSLSRIDGYTPGPTAAVDDEAQRLLIGQSTSCCSGSYAVSQQAFDGGVAILMAKCILQEVKTILAISSLWFDGMCHISRQTLVSSCFLLVVYVLKT